jgi:hypothetical protein
MERRFCKGFGSNRTFFLNQNPYKSVSPSTFANRFFGFKSRPRLFLILGFSQRIFLNHFFGQFFFNFTKGFTIYKFLRLFNHPRSFNVYPSGPLIWVQKMVPSPNWSAVRIKIERTGMIEQTQIERTGMSENASNG